MPDASRAVSFCQLLSECDRIEVPLIQRDYAQGRDGQKDVRNEFLGALHGALVTPPGDPTVPLNLDFVYGSREAGTTPRFLPLDGQQRLTTLFLLHWYLAWRDDLLSDFRQKVSDGRRSRFSYRVRPSSEEFFNSLVAFDPETPPEHVPSVRRMLEDQQWFFLHWRSDPTIQSVVTMLEAIHGRFATRPGFYARLVDELQPAITFHLLPLEHFGLSDDLYIKMNARGKPLTTFETFKARFEELLKQLFPTETRQIEATALPVPVFFERRMDTLWTDFFWNYQRAAFDDAALNLVWALIRVSLEPASPTFGADTTALGEKTLNAGFTLFHDRGWLTTRFANHLMDLLEAWSAGGGKLTAQLPSTIHFDEAAFFRRAVAAPAALKYLELVQFAAFVFYLTEHRGNIQPAGFREWMRVVTNLASNSDIERPEEFQRSLAGLQKLVPDANRILERLASIDSEPLGFSVQQLREEALKANLILSYPSWRERIDAAEAHGYFRGQIEFLLKFAGVFDRWLTSRAVTWTKSEDDDFQRTFSNYFAKASAVFSADGLKPFDECRWERALLLKGDYLLDRGINRCFLDNAERDASWKRLLRGPLKAEAALEQKRQYVRELLDDINLEAGVEQSLDAVLAHPLPAEPWRRAMIERPEVIDYCVGRKVRWHDNGNIYLLRRTQMNGDHAELFTLHLKAGLLSAKHEKDELSPFGAPQYWSVNGEANEPCAYLEWRRGNEIIALNISNDGGSYWLEVIRRWGDLPTDLKDALVSQAGFNVDANGTVYRRVERSAISRAIDEIVAVARQPLLAATSAT